MEEEEEEEARVPLLADVGQAPARSMTKHGLEEFRRRVKVFSTRVSEDDPEYLASDWSRRPYLGTTMAGFFVMFFLMDASSGLTRLAVWDLCAATIDALVLPRTAVGSIWSELFILSQIVSVTVAYSYMIQNANTYFLTGFLASHSLVLALLGLRVRYLVGAVTLTFVVFDRSAIGLLLLAISLGWFSFLDLINQRFFRAGVSLQRAQEALIQNASDGSCSVDANAGWFVLSCPRFQDRFRGANLTSRKLQDFMNTTDQRRVEEMLRSAKQGDIDHLIGSSVGACTTRDRNGNRFVSVDGANYQEMQVNSSAQESEDSMYDVMWDIVDAAASENVVTRYTARALVQEARDMQSLIFSQRTRSLQRAAARSLLARYDRIRVECLRLSVASRSLNQVVWTDRIGAEDLQNFEEHRLYVQELIIEDIVSVYRVFNHTETFRQTPCLHGMQTVYQMLGFFEALLHHRRRLRAPMRSYVQRFEFHG